MFEGKNGVKMRYILKESTQYKINARGYLVPHPYVLTTFFQRELK